MPREIKSIPVTFANTGIVLKSTPDEIPLTSYKALINVQTDRENSVSVRKGFARLNDGLGGAPYSVYLLKDSNGRLWRYAITGQRLYVAPVEDPEDPTIWPVALHTSFQAVPGGTGLSSDQDPRPFWTVYTLLGYEMKPYVFLSDGAQFLKHAGGLDDARRVGIPKPEPLLSVTEGVNSYTQIEEFEDKDLWTEDAGVTVTDVAGTPVSNGIQLAVNGDAFAGGAAKEITVAGYPVLLDLDNTDTDGIISMWVKFYDAESALNCKEIVITFGLGDAAGDVTFATSYQKAITPSSFEAASQPGLGGRTEDYDASVSSAQDALAYRNVKYLKYNPDDPEYAQRDLPVEDYQALSNQFDTGQTVQASPGFGVWNQIKIKKSDFIRVGQNEFTAPELNWSTVSAIRIDIKTIDSATGSKDCKIQFDDFIYLLTGRLTGVDLQWTYTYYNSLTDTESDYADPTPVPYPGANFNTYVLEFPVPPTDTAPKATYDKIRVYRLGGTLNSFRLVDTVDVTPGTAVADYTDNTLDSLTTDELQTDNQLPPDKVRGCIMWDDRLWTWGGETTSSDGTVQEPLNRLRYSKAVRVEHFPVNNYVNVGPGIETIMSCIEHDGELFVFTTTKVYRIVGSNGIYRAVGTAVNQGLQSRHGLCRGVRSVYMHAFDGIYEFPSGRKISEPLNQIFHNETANEIPPVALGRETETALAFWDSKVFFSYCSQIEPWTNGTFINDVEYFTAGGQPWQDGLGASYWQTEGIWYEGNPYTGAVTTLGAGDTPPGMDVESITNDRMLVWDTIYERWHFYLYGARVMYLEPETNILVGGTLVQWDSIVDGEAYNFHYSGAWPMRLEYGYADQCEPPDNWRGIFWAIDTKDFDLGMPDQEKRIFDYVVDADTQGTPIMIQVAYDQKNSDSPGLGEHESIGPIVTVGRQRTIMPTPMGEGDSVLAVRSAIRIIANTASDARAATRIYKIIHRCLPEPIRHRTFVTDWSDYGVPGPGFFRELWVEMDTFGKQLESIEVQIDQSVAQVLAPIPAVDGQQKLYLGITPDIRGTLGRLKFIPSGDNEVKVYDHNFVKVAEPPQINTIQTPWEDVGYPYYKLWKEILLDIDTNGMPMQFSFWLDGKVHESFSVTTQNGRQRITHSLEKDSFGKLGRLTLNETYYDATCCLPQGVRFYGVSYVIDKEPADVTFSDTYDQLWSFDRLKVLRRLWISMKNPDCDVTMEIWVDEELLVTETIAMDQMSTGFSKRRIDLESGLKGRLFRITFTGVFAFRLYWERSEWEIRDLNTEDGYRRLAMQPPQTF